MKKTLYYPCFACKLKQDMLILNVSSDTGLVFAAAIVVDVLVFVRVWG
jgi:hypothetical protein